MRRLLLSLVLVLGACDSGSEEEAITADATPQDSAVVDSTSPDTATAADTATSADTAVSPDTFTTGDTAPSSDTAPSADGAPSADSAPSADTSSGDAAGDVAVDSAASGDADAGTDADSAVARTALLTSGCLNPATAPGYYRGTLASNLNDISSVSGSCSHSAPGRDGTVRVELQPGQTVKAVYRHAGDGILYILDGCPVTASCLDGSDVSTSGAETVEWKNTGSTMNPVYVVLDSDSLTGAQTFELDLFVTGP